MSKREILARLEIQANHDAHSLLLREDQKRLREVGAVTHQLDWATALEGLPSRLKIQWHRDAESVFGTLKYCRELQLPSE